MSNTETQEQVTYKTCKVTVVTDGASDRVIKVYPALHEAEKIFLNNTPGVERWEAVRRFMNNYAERGTRVPNPVPYHDDAKNLSLVTLKEEDIPLVKLSGAVFEPLPEQKPAEEAVKLESSETAELKARLARLEALLTEKHGEKAASEEATFPCEKCDFTAKTKQAVAMHAGRMHKENK